MTDMGHTMDIELDVCTRCGAFATELMERSFDCPGSGEGVADMLARMRARNAAVVRAVLEKLDL